MHSKQGDRNLIAWDAAKLFLCLFVPFELEVVFFQRVAVRQNSRHLRLSKLDIRQVISQEPHHVDAAKIFLRL
jgi:hypothetical protein